MAFTFFGESVSQISQLPWWYEHLTKAVMVIIVIIVAYLFIRIYRSIVGRVLQSRLPEVANRARILGTWLIWAIAILIALDFIGLETTVLTYIFLLLGLAVVLSSKDLLANWITGQLIATESEFNIGDWIIVDSFHGRVVEMTSMNTVIVTADNKKIIIPNSFFSNHIVTNQTAYGGVCVEVSVTTDRRHDLSSVEKELLKIGEKVAGSTVHDRVPRVIIEEIGVESIKLTLHLWTLNPARIESMRSDANREIDSLLRRLEERECQKRGDGEAPQRA